MPLPCYDLDQLRLFIRDQKKAKRTATQEIELVPEYVFNQSASVSAGDAHTIIFTTSKFTVPDKKILAVQLLERQGGRHIEVALKPRKFGKISPLM